MKMVMVMMMTMMMMTCEKQRAKMAKTLMRERPQERQWSRELGRI